MDKTLYRAAMEGEVGVLKEFDEHQLGSQVTSCDNTALHVAAQFAQFQCVEMILQKCPALVHQVNSRGATPLHMAAKEGKADIAQAVINCAKELHLQPTKEILRAADEDGDTALHVAARYGHLEVVKFLTSEDPTCEHPPNKVGETPLYLAVERKYVNVALEILNTCTSPGYGGPRGRTAMHATTFYGGNGSIVLKALLERKPALMKVADAYGWMPIHYAALHEDQDLAKQILKKDKSMAYVPTNDNDKQTAIHICAAMDNVNTFEKQFLSECPDGWEVVDGRVQNILHIAVDRESKEMITYMLDQPWSRHLINAKDIDGNTPLHLAAAIENDFPYEMLRFFQPRADNLACNEKNLTPEEIRNKDLGIGGRNIASEFRRGNLLNPRKRLLHYLKLAKKDMDEYNSKFSARIKKMAKTHIVVATLLAALAFAAGFTIPGGYDSNEGHQQGMAILVREAAFKAFVISNTVAVTCSVSSVLLYVTASIRSIDSSETKGNKRYVAGMSLILIATGALMVAFIAGTYAALAHSLTLAISICVIGCITFFIYFIELMKLKDLFKALLGLDTINL